MRSPAGKPRTWCLAVEGLQMPVNGPCNAFRIKDERRFMMETRPSRGLFWAYLEPWPSARTLRCSPYVLQLAERRQRPLDQPGLFLLPAQGGDQGGQFSGRMLERMRRVGVSDRCGVRKGVAWSSATIRFATLPATSTADELLSPAKPASRPIQLQMTVGPFGTSADYGGRHFDKSSSPKPP